MRLSRREAAYRSLNTDQLQRWMDANNPSRNAYPAKPHAQSLISAIGIGSW